MKEAPRELGIETLTTPKGDVPTIKGLEKVINSVFSENITLGQKIEKLTKMVNTLAESLNHQSSMIKELSSNLTDLIVYLGKLEKSINQNQIIEEKNRTIEKLDLITIKEDLSRILSKIESSFEDSNR
jgi:hypothetical protein